MQFTKLRLSGFKSFVDPTELLIEAGLTGIVGPNGCGKSNLVEALQWVMGETSARRLRGGDMDDVIFGGTTSKPARNIATVAVRLDNSERTAPAQLNDQDELEIERRIDRGKGSTYRVNARETRAKDVQLLFADASSGAGSSALVGQGRIGWLINAKPNERRVLLEEAAGIGGLQSRRHEAELKLSAAETNLTRLEDVAQQLDAQIERLKKQARQAERYRRLSEQIRKAEALVLHRAWCDQTARLATATQRLAETEARVAEVTAAAESAQAARTEAQDSLPGLRQAAVDARHKVERLAAGLAAISAEANRVAQALRDNQQRLSLLDQDIQREKRLSAEADSALARLHGERDGLKAQQDGEADEQQSASELVFAAKNAVSLAEGGLSQATAHAAAREAERAALARRTATLEERRQRLKRQWAEAEAKTRELDLLAIGPERLAGAAAEVAEAEEALAIARELAEAAESAIEKAQAAEAAAREPVQGAERRAVKLKAEIDGLRAVVASGTAKGFAPVLDRVRVAKGLETALGAALGDDLSAALDPAAAIHWADLPDEAGPLVPLPADVETFDRFVEAPPALARRLKRIGLVADAETGRQLQANLAPGQRLATRDGAVWRWDGLTIAAGAPSAAATRLAQRNHLSELEALEETVAEELASLQDAHRATRHAVEQAQAQDRAARESVRAATQRIATARNAEANLVAQAKAAEARHQAATEAKTRVTQELAEAEAQIAEAESEREALPDPALDRQEVERLRAEVGRLRAEESLQQRELDRLVRDAQNRRNRLASIEIEARAWIDRLEGAAAQQAELAARREQLDAEIEQLGARPEELAAERATLEDEIANARTTAELMAGDLGRAEVAAAEAERAFDTANRSLGTAREDRVRAEAGFEQATEALGTATQRIRDAFEVPPAELPALAEIPEEPGPETPAELETRFDRLKREREAIGPVNLMAETEMAEMSEERETIRRESADLTAAIARLRQAIQQLNREGRERLTQAFDAVNAHFQDLFVRLFGGGRAYLELVQHETDPLQAGLEIMASPPGKKLQVLSLLSGGERALTALALVFAVFLTNPAPICVLDEVDAPLDDANVERFITLVREIGRRTGTRFLIITHHRVSMARMDRLYGVTMAEKGISQLVSVELSTADRLRQSA
ncbi:chromosome partition protein Smc [Aliidongia dinghuensis]|uniref:Chromosome partition protein Smc n=1 Tax=Aliidongia dinghuensis TaxID=1867774 RepID=A0A8J3E1Z4_9PROT|nr:chromosome segregation protein SMC [Aliidongia dinghuensis]GGF16591.1 chromosome partition protein Smc [Aliidongia dinghuensis]